MSPSEAAREIANAQLVAYNAHDLDGFMALFHEEAILVSLPEQEVLAVGKEAIRERYKARFATPGLHCEVTHRSEIGNIAIDRETVFTDAHPPTDALAMYEVVDHKIKRFFLIRA